MRNLFRYGRLFWRGHFHLHMRDSWVSIFVARGWRGDWEPYEELFRLRPIGGMDGKPIYSSAAEGHRK